MWDGVWRCEWKWILSRSVKTLKASRRKSFRWPHEPLPLRKTQESLRCFNSSQCWCFPQLSVKPLAPPSLCCFMLLWWSCFSVSSHPLWGVFLPIDLLILDLEDVSSCCSSNNMLHIQWDNKLLEDWSWLLVLLTNTWGRLGTLNWWWGHEAGCTGLSCRWGLPAVRSCYRVEGL